MEHGSCGGIFLSEAVPACRQRVPRSLNSSSLWAERDVSVKDPARMVNLSQFGCEDGRCCWLKWPDKMAVLPCTIDGPPVMTRVIENNTDANRRPWVCK